MLEKGPEQILSPGTITFSERGSKSTIGLVFGSETAARKFGQMENHYYDSGHRLILSEWNLRVTEKKEDPRLQFKKTDFETLINLVV